MHGTPQYLHSWLILVERGRRRSGRLSLTFPSSSAAKTFPGSKGGHSHTPSRRLQRPFSSYTSLWISSSLTHTNGGGGPQWQLIMIVMDGSCYSPLSCLSLYIVVFLPHSFTLSGGLIYTRQEWSPNGCLNLFLPAFCCISSPPFLLLTFFPHLPFTLHLCRSITKL